MSIYTRAGIFIKCFLFLAILAQCGKDDSKESGAKFTISPKKPIVITAKVSDGTKEYNPPWFEFRLSLDNRTGDVVTIVAVELEITGIDEMGQPSTRTVAVAPSDFNWSTDTFECNYFSFGTWQKNEDETFLLDTGNPACLGFPVFRIPDNPKGSYRYRVKMKPLGYFGDFGEANDRFEKYQYFHTQ